MSVHTTVGALADIARHAIDMNSVHVAAFGAYDVMLKLTNVALSLQQRGLIATQNDTSVRSADEMAPRNSSKLRDVFSLIRIMSHKPSVDLGLWSELAC